MNPLRWLASVIIDDLDDDGTVAVLESSSSTSKSLRSTQLQSTVTKASQPLSVVESKAGTTVEITRDESPISTTRDLIATPVTETTTPSKLEDTDEPIIPPVATVPVAISEVVKPLEETIKLVASGVKPVGDRWAIASPGVDLSGDWELIVTDDFKRDYDNYLEQLGQPLLVRSVALGIIGLTTEETRQADNGKSLLIRGKNVRGVWDRTLVASGTTPGAESYTPLRVPIMTADSEQVVAEAWWENEGTVHVSWLRGVAKYGGGEFESRRYLQDDGNVYVCETTFHRDDKSKEPVRIVWRFRRQQKSESA